MVDAGCKYALDSTHIRVEWSLPGTYALAAMWVEYHELVCGAVVRDVTAASMPYRYGGQYCGLICDDKEPRFPTRAVGCFVVNIAIDGATLNT